MRNPLKWCIDWSKPTFKDRFLMGSPFRATEDRVRQDIHRQLSERDETDLGLWNRYPPEVQLLAEHLTSRLKADGIWPSALFLPDDPADIPLGFKLGETDKWDFMPASVTIVEKDMGIVMDLAFWDGLSEMTFAQAIEMMIKKKAEPTDAAAASLGL
jgi:hypothetical protein